MWIWEGGDTYAQYVNNLTFFLEPFPNGPGVCHVTLYDNYSVHEISVMELPSIHYSNVHC